MSERCLPGGETGEKGKGERGKKEGEAARFADELKELFVSKGLTIAVAESFTGGLIAHTLTNVPGSSDFFLAGLCVYSIEAKVSILGVPRELIEQHGVVSAAVAEEMARRIRLLSGSSIGLATTGYAGPATGAEQLPVGTVFIGLSTAAKTSYRELHYDADRLGVKLMATVDALRLLIDLLWE